MEFTASVIKARKETTVYPSAANTKLHQVPVQRQRRNKRIGTAYSQVTICGSGLRSFGIRYDLYQCHPQIAGKLL